MNITEFEFAWLIGLLEGEGSFLKGPPCKPNNPAISLEMTDLDTIEKVSNLLQVKFYKVKNRNPERWKNSYSIRISGQRAIDWMIRLKPFMSERRQDQINQALLSYKGIKRKQVDLEIVNQITARYRSGETTSSLAKEFGYNRCTISKIANRKGYYARFDPHRSHYDKPLHDETGHCCT